MQFFLLMPGDSEEDTLNEANLLGEASFEVFWAGSALTTLMKIVDQEPDFLPRIKELINNPLVIYFKIY